MSVSIVYYSKFSRPNNSATYQETERGGWDGATKCRLETLCGEIHRDSPITEISGLNYSVLGGSSHSQVLRVLYSILGIGQDRHTIL